MVMDRVMDMPGLQAAAVGGGYGGNGGTGGDVNPGAGGVAYGNATDTIVDKGSGGAAGWLFEVDGWGGGGGGKAYLKARKIIIDSSIINVNGKFGADGSVEAGGGGSGGGILLRCDSIIVHISSLSAGGGPGGNAAFGGGGGGGGGRIKILYTALLDTSAIVMNVGGGVGGSGDISNGENGVAGSVYIGTIVGLQFLSNAEYRMISIRPNPARNYVRIELEAKSPEQNNIFPMLHLNIYDVSGRMVCQDNIGNKRCRLDLSCLKPGIYYLQVNQGSLGKLILLK